MKQTIYIILATVMISGSCKNKGTRSVNAIPPSIYCTPVLSDTAWYHSGKKAPLFDGLDVLHFPITTKSKLAQRYFDQGLALAYAFNHAEAARSFYYATRLDPECAMCYWGYAYVLGPNYNAGMEADNYQRAYKAIQKSLSLTSGVTKKEKTLIQALSKRYTKKIVEDRSALDKAYAQSMEKVFEQFPQDADVGALYAESLMDMHPWDLWQKDGKPKEWTTEILNTLENVFRINPRHIGANHFYIHAVEASPNPGKGYRSARLFDEGLVPGAGHLIHMPSHIYIRTGDYHKGSLANINAIKTDNNYITACHAQGVYPLAYMPHNAHFLAATATLAGNSKRAIKAASRVAAHANLQLMKQPGWGILQHYYVIPYFVYVKFGKWDQILTLNNADTTLKYPEAIRHYARGMAYLGKKKIKQAKEELAMLAKIADDKNLKEITMWNINSAYDIVQIAKIVLQGELAASHENFSQSIQLLEKAIAIEDELNYNEPPDWFFSVRHRLGAVQTEAGKYKDALQTFNEDLKHFPKNGWALHGMKLVYEKMGENIRTSQISKKLNTIWAYADVKLVSSRIK